MSGAKIVLVVVVIYLIFQTLIAGFTMVGDAILDAFDSKIEYDVDLGNYSGDSMEENDIQPEDAADDNSVYIIRE
jgi:hypothetical protein